jgi:hypothetical protein
VVGMTASSPEEIAAKNNWIDIWLLFCDAITVKNEWKSPIKFYSKKELHKKSTS